MHHENGVTYTWDENRWRVSGHYKLDESALKITRTDVKT